MNPQVTVSMLNWQRPSNVERIVEALRRQSFPCEVFLWDNSGTAEHLKGKVDYYHKSPENVRCWPKFHMLKQARTEFVCSMDDDLIPADPNAFAKCIEALRKFNCVVGPFGMRGIEGKNYEHSLHFNMPPKDESVDIVKGRFQMARQSVMADFNVDWIHNDFQVGFEEDIIFAAYVAGWKRNANLVLGSLCGSFKDMPVGDESLCRRNRHYGDRDRAFNMYLRFDLPGMIEVYDRLDTLSRPGRVESAFEKVRPGRAAAYKVRDGYVLSVAVAKADVVAAGGMNDKVPEAERFDEFVARIASHCKVDVVYADRPENHALVPKTYEPPEWPFRYGRMAKTQPAKLSNSAVAVVVGRNCKGYARKCLGSLLWQDYKDLGLIVVDDASDDGTSDEVDRMLDGREDTIVVHNAERTPKIASWKKAVSSLCDNPEAVIFWIDLDDWLTVPTAISEMMVLHEKYDVAWSQYWDKAFGRRGCCAALNGDVRKLTWRSSHLKTFKKRLFDAIDEADLKDGSGNWLPVAIDLAVMFPLIEMAGLDKCHFYDKVLYCYSDNPQSLHRTGRLQEQGRTEMELRRRQRTERVKDGLPLLVAVVLTGDADDLQDTLESLYFQSNPASFDVVLLGEGVDVREMQDRYPFRLMVAKTLAEVSGEYGRVLLTKAGVFHCRGSLMSHSCQNGMIALGRVFGSALLEKPIAGLPSRVIEVEAMAYAVRSELGNYPYSSIDADKAVHLALDERNVSLPFKTAKALPSLGKADIAKSGGRYTWSEKSVAFFRADL